MKNWKWILETLALGFKSEFFHNVFVAQMLSNVLLKSLGYAFRKEEKWHKFELFNPEISVPFISG